jgi:hypothetical protein
VPWSGTRMVPFMKELGEQGSHVWTTLVMRNSVESIMLLRFLQESRMLAIDNGVALVLDGLGALNPKP